MICANIAAKNAEELPVKRMTDLFAVVGKPVLHSKSPEMHNAAFNACGINAKYIRLASDSAEEALETAKELGINGFNVTSPFKEQMFKLVDESDVFARKTGAVNTVVINNGRIFGYNTDVAGVSRAFTANGINLINKKTLVVGAGGAARAAVVALLNESAKVTIANRTVENARNIANEFGSEYSSLEESELGSAMKECTVIIGCTSTKGQIIPKRYLKSGMVVLDANYSSETALVCDARTAGCLVLDAREWLLHQGVLAFELFTNRQAPFELMRKAVYETKSKDVRKTNVALIGFMGSGKTTVAKRISEKTSMTLFSIDGEIEHETGKRIQEIFVNDGETEFRNMERKQLLKLKNMQNQVIDCGGGAVLNEDNRKQLTKNATVIWLLAKPETVLERIKSDKSRPLLNIADKEERKAVAERLIKSRLGLYAETAHILINTEGKNPDKVAERIIYETGV